MKTSLKNLKMGPDGTVTRDLEFLIEVPVTADGTREWKEITDLILAEVNPISSCLLALFEKVRMTSMSLVYTINSELMLLGEQAEDTPASQKVLIPGVWTVILDKPTPYAETLPATKAYIYLSHKTVFGIRLSLQFDTISSGLGVPLKLKAKKRDGPSLQLEDMKAMQMHNVLRAIKKFEEEYDYDDPPKKAPKQH